MKKTTLVLLSTILLCFNCNQSPSSILGDFFFLDKTLYNNNQTIKDISSWIISQMEEVAKTKMQYYPIIITAKEIAGARNDFNNYIEELRKRIIEESGGFYSYELAKLKKRLELENLPINPNDQKSTQNIFLSNIQPQGVIIEQKIAALKKKYLDLVAELWKHGGFKGTIFAQSSKRKTTLEELQSKLTLSGSENYNKEVYGGKTWAEHTFENKSVAAILSLLRKFQNEAIVSENVLVNFLDRNLSDEIIYDKFELVCLSSKPYIRLGETFEAEIALGTYSSKTEFYVTVNGSKLKTENGKALFQTKATTIGEQKYTAKISFRNPLTEELETFTKEFSYEVGE